ncbi:amino acid permease [Candidatus Acidianus copahuensis]|uniref:Amino acid permease n=1 Tax=Candidatus Acidianus copahuensis TaxID=1160895 RepID=A0A031LPF9_9CREN|nr:APC family permease [Candidatus Acidianus copahuensis]EZQ10272.1 amino acid permease [Candidatus Acidianus copahuensis]
MDKNSPEGLRKGALSPWLALANSLASNAPIAVTALYFVGLAGLVGGTLTLVVILAWLIYLAMTIVTYEWSKVIASAYSWAAIMKAGYNSSGISFFSAWTYLYDYVTASSGFGVLGLTSFAYLIFPQFTQEYPWFWIPVSLIIIGETTFLMYEGIRPTSKYNLITGLIEISFLIITSMVLIALNFHKLTLEPLSLSPINGNALLLLTSMIFGISTFGGTNGALGVAEETKDPKKNIPKALIMTLTLVGVAIILNSYAQEISYGVGKMFNYANLPDPGIIIYSSTLGIPIAIIYAALVFNSFNSSTIGFAVSGIRMIYGMARDGALPKIFYKVNKKGVPEVPTLLAGLLNAALVLSTGFLFGPLNAALFLITSSVVFTYLNHMLASIGLIKYHYKNRTLNLVKHLLIPMITVLALGAAIVTSLYPAPPPPFVYGVYISIAFIVVIIGLYFYIKKKNPHIANKFGDYSL